MDKKQALNIARNYVERIKEKYDLKKAMLFGSYVRGTNNIDSDIDIALVFGNISDLIDMQIELMKLRRDVDLRIEPHPFKEEDFDNSDPIANEVIKSGIEL